MNRENAVWLWLLLIGGVLMLARGYFGEQGFGRGYYAVQPDRSMIDVPEPAAREALRNWEAKDLVARASGGRPPERSVFYSPWRSFGIWLAAFFTLASLSFLYKDNPLYKVAEHVFVGISAAYYMVIAFWAVILPNLIGKLFPRAVKAMIQPGLNLDEILAKQTDEGWFTWLINYDGAHYDGLAASWYQLMDYFYIIPVALGVMLLWRLAPKGQWISRWSLAFILGYTSGLRLVGFLGADFVRQIADTIAPLVVLFPTIWKWEVTRPELFYESMNNVIILLGVGCGLTYFFFSFEHKGLVGRVSRVGIWVLMITFGAGFGYTVMGRIALLVGRFQYLVTDWLNIIPR